MSQGPRAHPGPVKREHDEMRHSEGDWSISSNPQRRGQTPSSHKRRAKFRRTSRPQSKVPAWGVAYGNKAGFYTNERTAQKAAGHLPASAIQRFETIAEAKAFVPDPRNKPDNAEFLAREQRRGWDESTHTGMQ